MRDDIMTNKYGTMLEDIYDHDYYNNVNNCECKCKFYNECKNNMPDGGFRSCKAKIGNNYGKNKNPKIMFIGKEGVSPSNGIDEPAKVSSVEATNHHYFRTIYTAILLLTGIDIKADNINKTFLSKEEYDNLRHDFCLTNYFKCVFKEEDQTSRSGIKTNHCMNNNCSEILINEIKALRPDIIIIQGKFSGSSFYGQDGLLSFCDCQKDKTFIKGKIKIELTQYQYKDSKDQFYVLWGYHPCAWGDLWKNTLDLYKQALSDIPNTKYSGKYGSNKPKATHN